jgi:hypothetical protein
MNMLEIWLAVSILAGVVLFSLFIALGNERQRRELELLRKEAQAWALRDLAIKRSRLAAEIQVGEPCAWLNQVAAGVLGADPGLEAVQSTEDPEAILARAGNGRRFAFSPLDPSALRKRSGNGSGPRRGFARQLLEMARGVHPVLAELRRARAVELTALEGGTFFDLEAQKVWQMVTGKRSVSDRWWLYVGG